jgi:hypothetical protein
MAVAFAPADRMVLTAATLAAVIVEQATLAAVIVEQAILAAVIVEQAILGAVTQAGLTTALAPGHSPTGPDTVTTTA